MLGRLASAPRVQRVLSGAAALAVCATGCYLLGRTLDRSYPLVEWLTWRLAPIWGYALLFNLSAVVFGSFLLRRLLGERELPALERLLHSMMLGLTAFVLALYGFGFVGLFKPWMALSLPLIFLAAGWPDGRRLLQALLVWRRELPAAGPVERVLGGLACLGGAAALVFLYLESLDVSVINFDATWYHFPIAQDYARIGRIVPFPGENHRAYPHLTSMLHTWALLAPGLPHQSQHWMLSLHLEYSIVVWRLVGAAALARWLLGGRDVKGLWAGFFLFPSVFIYDQSIGGSADHFLGFYAVPIALAGVRALKAFDVRYAALLGIALGGHLLVKYQAMFLGAAAGAAIAGRFAFLAGRRLLRTRRGGLTFEDPPWRSLLHGAAAVGLCAILVSAPHFGKNVVFYNNPVYPFAQSVFTASYPKRAPGYYREAPVRETFAPKHSGVQRQLWALKKVFDYSLTTANRGLTSQRPYMGALFSLLLPCALLVSRRRRYLGLAGVVVIAFVVWANAAANDRYLLSFYDLCIGLTLGLMVEIWQLGWLARAGLVPLVGMQLLWGGDAMFYYGRKELEAGLTLIGSGYDGKYDSHRFNEKGAQRQITEATPPDAVILARNYKGLLGLDRTVLSDIRSAQDYVNYSHLKDPREFYELLRSRGVTHLLYPPGQRKPGRWNNVILFDELFLHHGRNRRRFGKLSLAELPPAPPPAKAPYLVLVSRIKGYPDGIYKLEQLDISQRSPDRFTPRPKPARRLEDGMALDDVSALVIGKRRMPEQVDKGELSAFESVETLDGDELYLRRTP
jgi:hypothetical protein